jgi:ribosomal protein S18 acetylase RimI-like enzyme
MIAIRRGVPADATVLAEFARRMYVEAFGAGTDSADLLAFLDTNYGAEKQGRELESADMITLLAEVGGRLVGYAQVRHSTPPDCVVGEDVVELWRFYIDRPFHGRGAAQMMMAAALSAARELGGRRIWLSVWEENPRAIAFYLKSGFEDVGTTDFWVGSERQSDRVLLRDLNLPGEQIQ